MPAVAPKRNVWRTSYTRIIRVYEFILYVNIHASNGYIVIFALSIIITK